MNSISYSQPSNNLDDLTIIDDYPGVLHPVGTMGIPNSVREALMQQGLTDAALVLDLCYFVGLRENSRFTVDMLHRIAAHFGIDLSIKLIRRGLNSAAFPEHHRPTTRKRGQPPVKYLLPGIAWLRDTFTDGKKGAADRLEARDFASAKCYRQGLYRTFIQRRPGQYSRRFMGKRLGVTARTVANYDAPCGIAAHPLYEQERIETQADFDRLPTGRLRAGRDFLMVYPNEQAYRLAEQGQYVPGRSLRDYGQPYPLLRYPGYRAAAQGQVVCRARQIASFYQAR